MVCEAFIPNTLPLYFWKCLMRARFQLAKVACHCLNSIRFKIGKVLTGESFWGLLEVLLLCLLNWIQCVCAELAQSSRNKSDN